MQSKTEIKLTSAEVAILWRTYITDTMSICVYRYFLQTVKDADVRAVVQHALGLSQQHIQTITDIFNKERYPMPQGFTDDDVDLSAPPLYSDTFVLFNLRYMARIGLNYYSLALPQMARPDMVDFLFSCVNQSADLTKRLINLKLEKGVYVRPPQIEIPDRIDFVDTRKFVAGFFGEKRSMIAGEVTQLFVNIQNNLIGKALLMGFIQVAESDQVKDYIVRGVNIANKHIETFTSKLKEENIPIPMPSDSFVTDSTDSPFSDKLMMFKLSIMTATGFDNYANATSTCMRHDIQADFIRLGAEVAKYGADGLKILIDNGWLEQPPQAIGHDSLVKV